MSQTYGNEPNTQQKQPKLSESGRDARSALKQSLKGLKEKAESASVIERLRIEKQITRVKQKLAWQGADPRGIPAGELREHIHAKEVSDDPLLVKYKARINNRATAIRAYCVWCMGGDTAAVRRCPTMTCPLHAFRMGKDPLRSYAIPKVEDTEELDGEDSNLFTTDDEDND